MLLVDDVLENVIFLSIELTYHSIRHQLKQIRIKFGYQYFIEL